MDRHGANEEHSNNDSTNLPEDDGYQIVLI